jgi:neutral trehalase
MKFEPITNRCCLFHRTSTFGTSNNSLSCISDHAIQSSSSLTIIIQLNLVQFFTSTNPYIPRMSFSVGNMYHMILLSFHDQSSFFSFSSNACDSKRKMENGEDISLRVKRVIVASILSRTINIFCVRTLASSNEKKTIEREKEIYYAINTRPDLETVTECKNHCLYK